MTTPAPPRARAGAAPVAVAAVLAVVATLPAFLTGALGVELRRDLGVTTGQLGIAVSSFFFLSAALSRTLGRLGDDRGAVAMLRVGTAIVGCAMALVAAVASSFPTLLALVAAAGIGHSMIQPALNAMLTQRVAVGRMALAFGIKQSAIPISALLSGLSIPLLVVVLGWRSAFVLAAVAALAATATIGRLLPPLAVGHEEREAEPDMDAGALRALALAGGLAAMGGNALAIFLVSAAVAQGIPQETGGVLLAVGSVVSVGVRVAAGIHVDRGRSDPLLLIQGLALVGSLGFLALLATQSWLFALGAVVAFGGAWGWPGLLNYAVAVRNPGAPGAASGLSQAAVSFGAASGPLVFGLIAASSYDAAFLTMTALVLAGGLVMVGVRTRLRGVRPGPA